MDLSDPDDTQRRDGGSPLAWHDALARVGPPMMAATTTVPGAAGVPQLDRDPLYERVYRELRRMLIEGNFAPGAELTLRALAEGFGTSDMPVRDAVRRLISEGALSPGPTAAPSSGASRASSSRRCTTSAC